MIRSEITSYDVRLIPNGRVYSFSRLQFSRAAAVTIRINRQDVMNGVILAGPSDGVSHEAIETFNA